LGGLIPTWFQPIIFLGLGPSKPPEGRKGFLSLIIGRGLLNYFLLGNSFHYFLPLETFLEGLLPKGFFLSSYFILKGPLYFNLSSSLSSSFLQFLTFKLELLEGSLGKRLFSL